MSSATHLRRIRTAKTLNDTKSDQMQVCQDLSKESDVKHNDSPANYLFLGRFEQKTEQIEQKNVQNAFAFVYFMFVFVIPKLYRLDYNVYGQDVFW